MKKLLNVLYVSTENAKVLKERETLSVVSDGEELGRFPIHMLQGLVTFGPVWVSPWAMQFCAERGVTISCFTDKGKFLARVDGPISGNVLLRKEQYRQSDSEERSLALARGLVAAKIANGRNTLQRHLRNHPQVDGVAAVRNAVSDLATLQGQCRDVTQLDSLRGIEGTAAAVYFSCFDHLVLNQKEDFSFDARNRRPPLDPVNAMLSFVYSLLAHDCRSALEGVGLDPQAGFLHRDRPGRPSLALDLAEEFRHVLADRVVLNLINLQQVKRNGFSFQPSGAVEMDDETRKTVLVAWQKKKQEEILHEYIGERIQAGLLFHVQALLLARTVRGDLPCYPAYVAR